MKRRRAILAFVALFALLVVTSLIYFVVVQYLSQPLSLLYRSLSQLMELAPQDWIWAAVVALAVLIGLRNFSSNRGLDDSIEPDAQGRYESLESWLHVLQDRKRGTYFGWRLANRLAELELQIVDHPDRLPSPRMREYLNMGHDRRTIGPANTSSSAYPDIDAVVAYLERRIEADHGG